MLGSDPGIARIRALIEQAASTDSNVLITGETGTGKELTAELVNLTGSGSVNHDARATTTGSRRPGFVGAAYRTIG